MPKLKIDRVLSFSSEDKACEAANILLPEPTKKWKCQAEGEKAANLILQLEKASLISGIDIGNEHSAYVEILVKRSGSADDFKVLLVMSSFMTPLESRQSTNVNKVRMFSYNDLQSPERDQKWDCVKVVCTQPFNRHVKYGLSFLTLHSTENSDTSNSNNLGKFTLRPDSPNNLTTGSLFARKRQLDITASLSAAASIREASSSPGATTKPKHVPPPKEKPNKNASNAEAASPKARNRDELLYSKDEEESHEKIDRIIKKRQQEFEEKTKNDKKIEVEKRNSTPVSSSAKRKLNSSASSSSSKKSKGKSGKPYNKLLEGVTIVISGIQNPERGDIRNRALELGAKYKPDWDGTCTHLICAFTNTPKFHQVKGKGKIVNRIWIQDCHTQRKRLPWRRYALDQQELNKQESEDEVCEEKHQTPDLRILHTSSNCAGSDTEDEIERITSLSKISQNNFNDDTDEENFYGDRSKNFTIPELPSVFSSKIMYVDEAFSDDQQKQMTRYIIALNGIVSDLPLGTDIIITTENNVDSLKQMCATAEFVSPNWLWASYNEKRLVPVEDYKL